MLISLFFTNAILYMVPLKLLKKYIKWANQSTPIDRAAINVKLSLVIACRQKHRQKHTEICKRRP